MVALLREHLAAGRLTTDEFRDRMDLALSAKTFGDLDPLLADLPDLPLDEVMLAPSPVMPAHPTVTARVSRRDTDRFPLRLAASGVVIATYIGLAVAFGVWWLPWFAFVVPILLIRHLRDR